MGRRTGDGVGEDLVADLGILKGGAEVVGEGGLSGASVDSVTFWRLSMVPKRLS